MGSRGCRRREEPVKPYDGSDHAPSEGITHPEREIAILDSSNRPAKPVLMALAAVIVTALLPWTGQWALLKTLIPLGIVWLLARRCGWRLADLGLGLPAKPFRKLGIGVSLAVSVYVVNLFTVRPLGRWLFEQPTEVASFDAIKGSLANLLVFLAFMWLLAAIAEEVIWRGFVFRSIGRMFGGSRWSWSLALVISAVIFGCLHAYQGPRGVLHATAGGLINGGLYWATGRRNLWLPILVHGFSNTISFVLIYLDQYDAVINKLSS